MPSSGLRNAQRVKNIGVDDDPGLPTNCTGPCLYCRWLFFIYASINRGSSILNREGRLAHSVWRFHIRPSQQHRLPPSGQQWPTNFCLLQLPQWAPLFFSPALLSDVVRHRLHPIWPLPPLSRPPSRLESCAAWSRSWACGKTDHVALQHIKRTCEWAKC